ncbi:MAG: hypothetical protein LPH21_18450 [Shewanella sp.]|nr:hypothetical protein [Shewanella sp.]
MHTTSKNMDVLGLWIADSAEVPRPKIHKNEIKAVAGSLNNQNGCNIGYSRCLNAVAAGWGYESYETLCRFTDVEGNFLPKARYNPYRTMEYIATMADKSQRKRKPLRVDQTGRIINPAYLNKLILAISHAAQKVYPNIAPDSMHMLLTPTETVGVFPVDPMYWAKTYKTVNGTIKYSKIHTLPINGVVAFEYGTLDEKPAPYTQVVQIVDGKIVGILFTDIRPGCSALPDLYTKIIGDDNVKA